MHTFLEVGTHLRTFLTIGTAFFASRLPEIAFSFVAISIPATHLGAAPQPTRRVMLFLPFLRSLSTYTYSYSSINPIKGPSNLDLVFTIMVFMKFAIYRQKLRYPLTTFLFGVELNVRQDDRKYLSILSLTTRMLIRDYFFEKWTLKWT
jgi:hypothetical protein